MNALATQVESCGRNEDRLLVDRSGDRTLLVVADGAGGLTNAAPVAQLICERVRDRFRQHDPTDWTAELRRLDGAIAASSLGGCATVVVLEIIASTLVGASVGDSEAWLLTSSAALDLTGQQKRKPLLGTGQAMPIAFGPVPLDGRVLLATDGLFKYASADQIADIARTGPVHEAVTRLVNSIRLRTGSLQDDVAVALYDGQTQ